jgi:hypothetical protein
VITADNESSIRLAVKLGFIAHGEAVYHDQILLLFRRPGAMELSL